MDIFSNMLTGFSIAATPLNLILCLVGCFVGTLIGVLPGIGPAATIALLLPVTFNLPPASAIDTAIVSLCTSSPTYLLNSFMTCPLNCGSAPVVEQTPNVTRVA